MNPDDKAAVLGGFPHFFYRVIAGDDMRVICGGKEYIDFKELCLDEINTRRIEELLRNDDLHVFKMIPVPESRIHDDECYLYGITEPDDDDEPKVGETCGYTLVGDEALRKVKNPLEPGCRPPVYMS